MPLYQQNTFINNSLLPAEIVLHPSWWFKNTGITFDKDFFYHPAKRVEAEQKMEQVLYDRFGQYGLGKNHNKKQPVIGAVHNAAGYILSEMLGCKIKYMENAAPQILPADQESLIIDPDKALNSKPYQELQKLSDQLKTKYGYITGDINWGGILNIALDVRGSNLFMDMFEKPDEVQKGFQQISNLIERFVTGIETETGSSSISVNRNVINIDKPVYLHSECSHTMISNDQYEQFLLPFDMEWSKNHRPYGIHYCGPDPHRYAESFAKLPYLDFLDAGWGGDIKTLRQHLPNTFLNIRLDPVSLTEQSPEEIRQTVHKLVKDSGNPYLTGVCCINMDDKVSDKQISAIFEAVNELRTEYQKTIQ